MQPRVTTILVARNGAQYLERTLEGIAAQTRRPDSVIFVDAGSSDSSAEQLIAADPTQLVTTPGSQSFGSAVAHGLQVGAPIPVDNDWLWVLAHDSAPEPGALAALLGAVEIAPSVAVAGPKLMQWDDPDVIARYGETMTPLGASVLLVSGELDQAQHDSRSDFLAVAATGMLVRRQVWSALGGFDPGLPSVDAALDFCIRVRLAGHRVVGVPGAKVASAGGPELFGRRSVSASAQHRIARAAQLHRRLAYAPAAAVPFHWLSLVPLAILRSLWHLIAKRPGVIAGELATGFSAAFDRRVASARRNGRKSRKLGWAAIAPLRITWPELRELRAHERSVASVAGAAPSVIRPGFFVGGGAWIVLIAAIAGLIAFGPFIGAAAISGGALVPLASTVGELWSSIGWGWHDIGSGFTGPADPFAYVVAVLGSLTFWAPSLSVVLFTIAAVPLAALSAWVCAVRFSERAWAPAIAALLWALAPPLLAALNGGHLGAAIAHVLLPWLVLAVIGAPRNWSYSAGAAILFAIIAASAPIIVPALLLAWLAWLIAHPAGIHRLIGIPIPAAALFAPLVFAQFSRGTPLALLAEPGVPTAGGSTIGWQLAIGSTDATLSGWPLMLAMLGLPENVAPVVLGLLLAPLAAVALLALFLPGAKLAIPSMVIALLGFVTAVVGVHLQLTTIGSTASTVWPGAGLSLYWMGLLGAVIAALEALTSRVAIPALVVAIASAAAVVPLIIAPSLGTSAVSVSSGRLLPAFTTAEAAPRPSIGTLQLTALSDGAIGATVHRGTGTTLDEQSTFDSTSSTVSATEDDIATLAGNLASHSGFDTAGALQQLQIAFVLVPTAGPDAEEARQRVTDALDGNRLLTPIGSTANGFLWHYAELEPGAAPAGPGPTESTIGLGILIGQAVVFLLTLLLAIPTGAGRRRVRAATTSSSDPATTFEAEDND